MFTVSSYLDLSKIPTKCVVTNQRIEIKYVSIIILHSKIRLLGPATEQFEWFLIGPQKPYF